MYLSTRDLPTTIWNILSSKMRVYSSGYLIRQVKKLMPVKMMKMNSIMGVAYKHSSIYIFDQNHGLNLSQDFL